MHEFAVGFNFILVAPGDVDACEAWKIVCTITKDRVTMKGDSLSLVSLYGPSWGGTLFPVFSLGGFLVERPTDEGV